MAIFARNERPVDGASEAAPSGWPAMFKALRDADVAKVDDCRDDIDTLLVFAGLYSAVLTAFVIESYTHLQQDSQDVIIGLLQQIAAQNFTSGPGFLNSTNPSPSFPSFEPPLWAVRVNILWFTSLLLSLASASFGILVKQWLREYLALEYAAPRERLRARQYRNPAMSDWKVFEIAAFLPLLLQVSLGLFFVGLCFFTAAVHDSVGRTTVPLVCAWAFLLLITTIAPLFSPRCPYKTMFLKRALRVGRRYISPTLGCLSRSLLLILYVCRAKPTRQKALEEDDIVNTEAEDVEILLSVDSLVSDDGLLPTMLAALQQRSGASLEEISRLPLQVIGRRINMDLSVPRLRSILNLRPLSKVAWFAVTDAIAGLLQRGAGPLESSRPDWIFNSVVILLSPSRFELSDATLGVIRKFLPRTQRAHDHQCTVGITVGQRFTEGNTGLHDHNLAQCLLRLRMPDTVICLRCIMDVCTFLLCQDPTHSHPSLRHLLDSHTGEDILVEFPRVLILHLLDILVSFLLATISSQKNLEEIHGSHEALHIILQYGEKFGRRDDALKVCRQTLLTGSSTCMLVVQFAALHPQCRVSEDIRALLNNVSYPSEDDSLIRSHLTATCELFCNDDHDGNSDIQLDYVRFYAVFAPWMRGDQTAQAFAKAIEKYHRTRGWQQGFQRGGYWYSDAQSPESKELLKADQDLACEILGRCYIPTELINALWLFVPRERGEEVLYSIRERGHLNYVCTPPTPPAPSTSLEDSESGQGGESTAEGAQKVGNGRDATKCGMVDDGRSQGGGDAVGEGDAQGTSALAGELA